MAKFFSVQNVHNLTIQAPNFHNTHPGAVGGTLLDGIHGTVGLLKYDVLPFDIDSINLHSSLTVPVLLGSFYAVAGCLINYIDIQLLQKGDLETAVAIEKSNNPTYLILSYFLLAQFLAASALMFDRGYPFGLMNAVLGFFSFNMWQYFDKTKQVCRNLGLYLIYLLPCAIETELFKLSKPFTNSHRDSPWYVAFIHVYTYGSLSLQSP